MKVEPGIYYNVPFDEYLKWEAVNNSLLKVLDKKSPAHAREEQLRPRPSSKAFDIGRALHMLNLEPANFPDRYAVAPECDRRTKEGKEIWIAFQELCKEKTVIDQKDYNLCHAMHTSIRQHMSASRYIIEGRAEVCIVWVDKETGILCKARLDYVHEKEGVIADLKTTVDASPLFFPREIAKYDYHRQAAMYTDGYSTLTGEPSCFLFIAVEKVPPYAVATYQADEHLIEAGRRAYQRSLAKYKICADADLWEAYPQETQIITLPAWALFQEGVSQGSLEYEPE